MSLDCILVLLMISCERMHGCVWICNLHISFHQLVHVKHVCKFLRSKFVWNSATLHKRTCHSQRCLTLICLLNECWMLNAVCMFAAVAVSLTLHAHKGVITISYPLHTEMLMLHHLHSEFTNWFGFKWPHTRGQNATIVQEFTLNLQS